MVLVRMVLQKISVAFEDHFKIIVEVERGSDYILCTYMCNVILLPLYQL